MKDINSSPSNSKSEDTLHRSGNYCQGCEDCEPPLDTSLDDILDQFVQPGTKYLKDVQADIMAWHEAKVAKLLQVIEDEVEVYNIKSRNGEIVEPNTGAMAVPLEALKQIKDNVINGGSL